VPLLKLVRKTTGVYRTEGVFNGFRVRHSLETKDRTVARARLQQYEAALLSGDVKLTKQPKSYAAKFKLVANKYLRSRATGKGDTTRRTVEHLVEHWGEWPIRQITLEDIEDYIYNTHTAKGHADSTIRRVMTTIQAVMNFGAKMDHNDYIKLDKPPEGDHATDTITDEQFEEILKHLQIDVARISIFLRYTGARPIEAVNLTYADVDFERNLVTLKSLKGRGGINKRQVPLHERARNCIPYSSPLPPPHAKVFHIAGMEIRNSDHMSKHWKVAREKVDMPQHIGMYALRHTFATELCRKGVPVKVVADLLGHKDLKMVVRYMNTTLDDHTKAIHALT